MKGLVVIGDGQIAKAICEFPGVLGYVNPKKLRHVISYKDDSKICKLDKRLHLGVVGIAEPKYKKESTELWIKNGYKLGLLVHPNSIFFGKKKIGKGSVIFPYTYIDGDSEVGKCCFIGPQSIVHNSKIADYSHLTLGVKVIHAKVEKGVLLGAGSIILNNRVIGEGSVIGAGSIVKRNIPKDKILIQSIIKEELTPKGNFKFTVNFQKKDNEIKK